MQSKEPDDVQEGVNVDKVPPPPHNGVGSRLDWSSAFESIVLCVELPFWLLMPSSSFNVSVGGISTTVSIDNDGIEVQRGRQFTKTHKNTVYIGGSKAACNSSIPVTALPEGGLFRATRTLLYIETHAIADALDAFFGPDGPRYQDGYRYFASLALGHLSIVNEVINAYRKASIDPFANEITAWDVPVWFVLRPPDSGSVCLNAHLAEDWYPTIRKDFKSDEAYPFFAVSKDCVLRQISRKDIPGEIEMLDGWSLFHRGRYGDSIRSFVTAIEVLVEAEVRRLLAESGMSEEHVRTRIDNTRNNFDKRLGEYCLISKRRIPGPVLHYIPWLNGLRLANELDHARRLRHRIVHHGHRLDHAFSKPMLRAAETTSWLFDWLASNDSFEERRSRNHAMFFGWRTEAVPFDCIVQEGRVVVRPLFPADREASASGDDIVIASISRVVHSDSILYRTLSRQSCDGKDVEHFVKMAFFELGVGELADSPFETSLFPIPERFRMTIQEKLVLFFVLDTPDSVGVAHIEQVQAFLADRRKSGVNIGHAILVVNDQMDREWHQRVSIPDDNVDQVAHSCGISVVRTACLAKAVLGAIRYRWSVQRIIDALMQPGLQACDPPSSKVLGNVYKFWEKPKVIGIQPLGSASLQVGDIVAVLLRDRFHQHEIGECMTDCDGRITFKCDINRADVLIGAHVFLLDRELSIRPSHSTDNVTADDTDGGFGNMFAFGAVHPSR